MAATGTFSNPSPNPPGGGSSNSGPDIWQDLLNLYKGDFGNPKKSTKTKPHQHQNFWESFGSNPQPAQNSGSHDDSARIAAKLGIKVGPNGNDPNDTIPKILGYLRDSDRGNDPDWSTRFPLVQAYVNEAYRQMQAGELGYSDPKLRAAIVDARIILKVHQHFEKRADEKTPWTDQILAGQPAQQRLLTYPQAFPKPEPNRAQSDHRPWKPAPRPQNLAVRWGSTLLVNQVASTNSTSAQFHPLYEVSKYVESEDKYFWDNQYLAKNGHYPTDPKPWDNVRFDTEIQAYEFCMRGGAQATCTNVPPNHPPNPPINALNPDGTKGPRFYQKRGWQRAALQQCLNLFTNHENRAINTPWRRAIMPFKAPAPLPKDIAYVPRLLNPADVPKTEKDPFVWLHGALQYNQILDLLAGVEKKCYINKNWSDFQKPALPTNFRGPSIYRGLSVYDQHWLKIGDYLDNLEKMIGNAWGAAPRPLMRAIMRDIDAGRKRDAGVFDDDEQKRYTRRDIVPYPGIDTRDDDNGDLQSFDENFKLIDEHDIAWLKYICEPSRTLEMCNSSKQLTDNLTILFDAKLQEYFGNLELSGVPNPKPKSVWDETSMDLDSTLREFKGNTLEKVVAYINGCDESELMQSGENHYNHAHPNQGYQFTLDEAEFLCVDLQNKGRCTLWPGRRDPKTGKRLPSYVDRPKYRIHPEDRVLWRYEDTDDFQQSSKDYANILLHNYHDKYGHWLMYKPDRITFSKDMAWMLDHVGPDFPFELVAEEIRNEDDTDSIENKRKPYIEKHIVPEHLFQVGPTSEKDVESLRAAPYWADLSSWETVGNYIEHWDKVRNENRIVRMNEPFFPITPEKTAQFFRRLAFRMGRTMRHVEDIRDRLQYVEKAPADMKLRQPLDLCPELKDPRPDIPNAPAEVGSDPENPVVAKKWWQPISYFDYGRAVEKWQETIHEGTGEIQLLPPDIRDVIATADPDSSFRKGLLHSDPFAIVREGIISDCVRNRDARFPFRLGGLKDARDKEFQGFQRPNLFEWATKEQRRFQAPHTRRHFFNMQRWPSNRILPERAVALRERKDEVLRRDPSQADQAYGILTHRLPVGKEKPVYARPLIDHHHHHHHRWQSERYLEDDHRRKRQYQPHDDLDDDEAQLNKKQKNNKGGGSSNNKNNPSLGLRGGMMSTSAKPPPGPDPFTDTDGLDNPTTHGQGSDGQPPNNNNNNNPPNNNPSQDPKNDPYGKTPPQKPSPKRSSNAVSYRGSQFAPGPAIFPMGESFLQKLAISLELEAALNPAPSQWWTLGLPSLWRSATTAVRPPVPLLPPAKRGNIPRSNPNKRKMPIEFLNRAPTVESAVKKFRSDKTVPLQWGGSGGQFGAALGHHKIPPAGASFGSGQPKGPNNNKNGGSNNNGNNGNNSNNSNNNYNYNNYNNDIFVGHVNLGAATTTTATGANTNTNTNTSTSLPLPSEKEAASRLKRDFPRGWDKSWNLTVPEDMFESACKALRASVTRQLYRPQLSAAATTQAQSALADLDVAPNDFKYLLDAPELARVKGLYEPGDGLFAVGWVAALLEAWGDKRKTPLRLQLGILVETDEKVENPAAGQYPKVFKPYLIPSRYDASEDKAVVWIRLKHDDSKPKSIPGPYKAKPYNSYTGVRPRTA